MKMTDQKALAISRTAKNVFSFLPNLAGHSEANAGFPVQSRSFYDNVVIWFWISGHKAERELPHPSHGTLDQ